jgi:hypothetical protein
MLPYLVCKPRARLSRRFIREIHLGVEVNQAGPRLLRPRERQWN